MGDGRKAAALALWFVVGLAVAARAGQDPPSIDALITAGRYVEAERAAQSLAARAKASGDFGAAARALLQQSDALYYLGQPDRVDQLNREALALAQRAGDEAGIGRALYNLSFAYERREPARMIAMLERAVPYATRAGDRRLEMNIENAFGTAYFIAGPYSAAIAHFMRSGELAAALGDQHGSLVARANVALMHRKRGEHDIAIKEYESVIAAMRAANARGLLAQQLGNLGEAYRSIGDVERALRLFEEALRLQHESGYRRSEAVLLADVASAYWDLGDQTRAEAAARQALSIADELGDRRNGSSLLTTLARWRVEQRRVDEARAHARDARARAEALGDLEAMIDALMAGAEVERAGDRRGALTLATRASLLARHLGDPYLVGTAEALRAELLADDDRRDEAIDAWRAAIREHERTHTRQFLHLWHARLADLYAGRGDRDQSRREFEISVRLIDDLDAVIALDRFRITLFRDVARVFRQYASRLVEWGEPMRAWTVLERGRARDLALRLTGATTAATLSDTERDALARLTELHRTLQEGSLTPARRAVLLRDVDDAEAGYERARLAAGHDAPAADLPDVELPTSDTLVVEYAVNGDELLIFSARDGRISVRRAGGAAALLERVRRFIEVVSDGTGPAPNDVEGPAGVDGPARTLAETLLDPELRPAAPHRLIIVADDVLQYLPFGALIDEHHRFLAEHVAISTTPSLTTLRQLAAPSSASARLLAVGNSRFDGTTFLGQPLPPLPFSAEEARMVARHGAGADLLIDATEAQVRELDLSRYGVIHFATHALIDDARSDRSCVVLAPDAKEDGLLQARELYGLRLDCRLAVLSGCETGRGSLVSGEGVLGLSHALFSAGARSVVITLWKVSDEATGEFMHLFYDALARQMTIADALGDAQRRMIASSRWHHPAYWAGFIVAGNADQQLPLRTDRRTAPTALIGGAAGVVLVGLVIRRRRRRRTRPELQAPRSQIET